MDITPLVSKESRVINRYGDGGFVINGTGYKGNILLLPENVATWHVEDFISATEESLNPLFFSGPPEILLIGVGAKFMRIPSALQKFFSEKKVSADAMDTGAACRTYNILVAEGRHVAAALIAV